MAIIILSTFIIALPASIFNIIYGKNRFFLRKEFFFLLDPFTKGYKFISLIYILKQILSCIGMVLYKNYSIIMNSYLLIINLGFLSLNLIYLNNAYENFPFLIRNSLFEISLLVINYFLIIFENDIIKITFSSFYILAVVVYLSLNFFMRANTSKKKKKNPNRLNLELDSWNMDYSEKLDFPEKADFTTLV